MPPARATLLSIALIAVLAIPGVASAQRKATERESTDMWNAVEKSVGATGCAERRGRISTAGTKQIKFGTVVIADATCGNGQFVLSKRRHRPGAKWRIRGAGSDWGNPDRCADDLRKIPRPVLEDFFGPDYCKAT